MHSEAHTAVTEPEPESHIDAEPAELLMVLARFGNPGGRTEVPGAQRV